MWYPNTFQSVAHVVVFIAGMTDWNHGVSHPKFYISHAEKRSVETVYRQTVDRVFKAAL